MAAKLDNSNIYEWTDEDIGKDTEKVLHRIREDLSCGAENVEVVTFAFTSVLHHIAVEELEDRILGGISNVAKEIFVNSLRGIENLESCCGVTQTTQINPTDACSHLLLICCNILHSLIQALTYFKTFNELNYVYVQSFSASTSFILTEAFAHIRNEENYYPEQIMTSVRSSFTDFRKSCNDLQLEFLRFLAKNAVFESSDLSLVLAAEDYLKAVSRSYDSDALYTVEVWKMCLSFFERFQTSLIDNCAVGDTLNSMFMKFKEDLLAFLTVSKELTKQTSNSLKIFSFMLKVLIKLCRTFGSLVVESFDEFFEALSTLYNCNPSYLTIQLGQSEELSEETRKQIVVGASPLLSSLISVPGFKEVLLKKVSSSSHQDPFIKLQIFLSFLKKSPVTDKTDLKILEEFFNYLQECGENIAKGEQRGIDSDFYEDVLITMATAILTITPELFSSVEMLLLKNLLSEDPIIATLASDLWCLICRCGNDEICETTVNVLIESICCLDRRSHRPAVVHMEALIRRLVPLCGPNFLESMVARFPPKSNPHIWRVVELPTISETDEYSTTIQHYWSTVADWLSSSDYSPESHLFMEDCLLALKGTPDPDLSTLKSLWQVARPQASSSCSMLTVVASLTSSLIMQLPSYQISVLLQEISSWMSGDASRAEKLVIMELLNDVINSLNASSEYQDALLEVATPAFKSILDSGSNILYFLAMESLTNIFEYPGYEVLVEEVIGTSEHYSDFLRKKVTQKPENYEITCKMLPFSHYCVEQKLDVYVEEPPESEGLRHTKKLKVDGPVESLDNKALYEAIDRLKTDAEFVTQQKVHLSSEQIGNIRKISYILSLIGN